MIAAAIMIEAARELRANFSVGSARTTTGRALGSGVAARATGSGVIGRAAAACAIGGGIVLLGPFTGANGSADGAFDRIGGGS